MEKCEKPLRISEKECSSNSSLPDDKKRINRRVELTVSFRPVRAAHFCNCLKFRAKLRMRHFSEGRT